MITIDPNRLPTAYEERRAKRREIAAKMAESGAFEVFTLVAVQNAIADLKTKYPVQTAGMTDDQIVLVVTDPESPFYNEGFTKLKSYYDEMAAL